MGRPRILPDDVELRRLRRDGNTIQTIADTYDVSTVAVERALQRARLTTPKGGDYSHVNPWAGHVARKHRSHYHINMLRLHGRRELGHTLEPQQQRRLDAWLQEMNHQHDGGPWVVTYNRETGFDIAPKQEGDWQYARPWPEQEEAPDSQ